MVSIFVLLIIVLLRGVEAKASFARTEHEIWCDDLKNNTETCGKMLRRIGHAHLSCGLPLRTSVGKGIYCYAFQVDDNMDEYHGNLSIRVVMESVYPKGIELVLEKENTGISVHLWTGAIEDPHANETEGNPPCLIRMDMVFDDGAKNASFNDYEESTSLGGVVCFMAERSHEMNPYEPLSPFADVSLSGTWVITLINNFDIKETELLEIELFMGGESVFLEIPSASPTISPSFSRAPTQRPNSPSTSSTPTSQPTEESSDEGTSGSGDGSKSSNDDGGEGDGTKPESEKSKPNHLKAALVFVGVIVGGIGGYIAIFKGLDWWKKRAEERAASALMNRVNAGMDGLSAVMNSQAPEREIELAENVVANNLQEVGLAEEEGTTTDILRYRQEGGLDLEPLEKSGTAPGIPDPISSLSNPELEISITPEPPGYTLGVMNTDGSIVGDAAAAGGGGGARRRRRRRMEEEVNELPNPFKKEGDEFEAHRWLYNYSMETYAKLKSYYAPWNELILDLHNEYRDTIARGESSQYIPDENSTISHFVEKDFWANYTKYIGSIPPNGATNMNSLLWDDGLASLASEKVARCVSGMEGPTDRYERFIDGHAWDSKFSVPNEQFHVGELSFSIMANGPNYNFLTGDLLSLLTVAWYSKKYFHYGKVELDENGQYPAQFSQMVWAKTRYVGCGYSANNCLPYDVDENHLNMSMLFMVCNYYPSGNIGGEYPWEAAKDPSQKCSNCDSDRTDNCVGTNSLWYVAFLFSFSLLKKTQTPCIYTAVDAYHQIIGFAPMKTP